MADLSKLVPAETTRIKIKDPITDEIVLCDDGSEMYIDVYGSDSKQHRKIVADIARKKSKKNAKNLTIEELDEILLEQSAKSIVDWNIQFGKDKVKFTYEKAVEILTALKWLREQVADAVQDRSLFLESQPSD